MIDIESLVFSRAATSLREEFPGIWVAGEFVDVPAKFPAVTITESNNSVMNRMRTNNIENVVSLMYEVNVYTNTVGTKKQEAKRIMARVDDLFSSLGFERILLNPVANLSDGSIYRLLARYEAAVDKDFWIYRNN